MRTYLYYQGTGGQKPLVEAPVSFLEKIACQLCNNSVTREASKRTLFFLTEGEHWEENNLGMKAEKVPSQENPEPLAVASGRGDTLKADKSAQRQDKEKERIAIQRAKDRARTSRWDLNIAIFLFVVLIIVIILLFQGVPLEIVAPVAIFGLGMVWLVGWRQGRQLFERYCEEELAKLEYERTREVEETIEEAVRKAIRERLR